MIKKNFGLDRQPLVDAQTNILLVWILVFLIVFASIPLGLAVGLATVLMTNLLEITDLSLYPEVSTPAKFFGSAWIIIFILYFASQVANATEKHREAATFLRQLVFKPFVVLLFYFTLLFAVGIFLRL